MELTEAQYERIAWYLLVQRGNVNLSNRQVSIPYVVEHGCKWRGLQVTATRPFCLSSACGNPHTLMLIFDGSNIFMSKNRYVEKSKMVCMTARYIPTG